jgi:hypothetical protein
VYREPQECGNDEVTNRSDREHYRKSEAAKVSLGSKYGKDAQRKDN